MMIDKNQTIEEILSFKRPESAYKQLYSATAKGGKHLKDKLGILPSLVFSLVVVVLVSWGLSTLEAAINTPKETVDNNLSKIEESVQSKIHWGTVARAILMIETAHAAEPEVEVRDDGYSSKFISQSIPDPIEIEAGDTKTVVIKFKNLGTATWNSSGSRFISAYTMEPRDRKSEFQSSSWGSGKQTGKIAGVVAPGEIGELKIELKAPEKVGEYIERFYLAAENYSWLEGGYFFLKIKVVPKIVEQEIVRDNPSTNAEDKGEYEARRLILSKKTVQAVGGEKIKVIVGYRNKGTATWGEYKLLSTVPGFEDSKWIDGETLFVEEEEILPDSFLRKTFYFRVPVEKGNYTATFEVNIDDGELIETIEIPVEVTADAPSSYNPPEFKTVSDSVVIDNIRLATEPRLRAGIAAPTSNFIQFRSYEDDYNVFAGTEKQGVLKKKKFAVIKYIDGQYSFKGGGIDFIGNEYIRLEPANNAHAVYHVPNLISRTASWVSPTKKFNKYRGALEYRRGEVDEKMYIVNDLLMEDYIRGIAENSRLAPIEMVKANLVAARNYAYVAKNKYPFFDVLCNTYDQLYLGYEVEEVLPNVQAAALAVRGVVMTYDDKIITTPYFGNSNGWTKSYPSVWGGSAKPWLVPVQTNYDTGRRMLGHGVGMSQRDAAYRAEEEGLNFVELLKYYYTGVQVEHIYN
jgi:hypothetical protein